MGMAVSTPPSPVPNPSLQFATALSPPPQNDHRPIVAAPPSHVYYTWTLYFFIVPGRYRIMRLLLDQRSYDEMLSKPAHPRDCYVRGADYLHHLYADGVKYL